MHKRISEKEIKLINESAVEKEFYDKHVFENILPADIENRSMEIIEEEIHEMGPVAVKLWSEKSSGEKKVIKRAIHTSADFDYLFNMFFTSGAVEKIMNAMKRGCTIITDTNMAKTGINKTAAEKLGCTVKCFMAEPEVFKKAEENGTTRAVASMEIAAEEKGEYIIAVGNAPTALVKINELLREGKMKPEGIIGVPVGFVNVVPAKELIVTAGREGLTECIVARGRKGGSNVAAAIVNSLMYMCTGRK